MLPSEEIIYGTILRLEHVIGGKSLLDIIPVIRFFYKGGTASDIDFDHFYENLFRQSYSFLLIILH